MRSCDGPYSSVQVRNLTSANKLQLYPMDAAQHQRRSEAGCVRGERL
jgi:hypothetical protein